VGNYLFWHYHCDLHWRATIRGVGYWTYTAAAGASSAAMTVTASTVLSSAVPVICAVNGYSGTGQPIVTISHLGLGPFIPY